MQELSEISEDPPLLPYPASSSDEEGLDGYLGIKSVFKQPSDVVELRLILGSRVAENGHDGFPKAMLFRVSNRTGHIDAAGEAEEDSSSRKRWKRMLRAD